RGARPCGRPRGATRRRAARGGARGGAPGRERSRRARPADRPRAGPSPRRAPTPRRSAVSSGLPAALAEHGADAPELLAEQGDVARLDRALHPLEGDAPEVRTVTSDVVEEGPDRLGDGRVVAVEP